MAYTDFLNEALDDLVTTLQTISGLRVVNDPRNIAPPCAFVDAPSIESFNYNIVKMTFPVTLISTGPGNLDAQRSLMNLAALVLGSNVGITAGRPTMALIGGVELPAYDLTVNIQAQTS